VVHELTRRFAAHFSFTVTGIDDEDIPYCLEDPQTGDLYTYDCSYNNLEFSFARTQDLHEVNSRFKAYYRFIQQELAQHGHTLTGMGVNPHRTVNNHIPLPVGRYQMLYHFLSQQPPNNGGGGGTSGGDITPRSHGNGSRGITTSGRANETANEPSSPSPHPLHPFPEYGMFTSASQIQIDVDYDALVPTIRALSNLEPLKAVLFANSPLMHQGIDYLCCRDMLWEQSRHGTNPRNVGMFEHLPASPNELLDYLTTLSMFCTERDGRYLSFAPIPVLSYFKRPHITGTYLDPATRTAKTLDFAPQPGDLAYLRAYKLVDLTFRGTIEYRSVCCQPVRDTMAAPAFHWGLANKVDELNALLDADKTVLNPAHTSPALRRLFTYATYPHFVDPSALRALLLAVLDLAASGLRERGRGEEVYLAPLFERAHTLQNPAHHYRAQLASGHGLIPLIKDYAALD
jgi:gamma-glutamylcysteine synthetase